MHQIDGDLTLYDRTFKHYTDSDDMPYWFSEAYGGISLRFYDDFYGESGEWTAVWGWCQAWGETPEAALQGLISSMKFHLQRQMAAHTLWSDRLENLVKELNV